MTYRRQPAKPALKVREWPRAKESIRIMSMGAKKSVVRLTFSSDLAHELIAMYDKIWFGQLQFARRPKERYKYLRLQFAAFYRLNMPGCFVRLTPPVKDQPRGTKMVQRGQRFAVQISARKLGLRRGLKAKALDYALAPREFGPQGGIVIWFEDDDCKMPSRRELKAFAKKDEDLLVR